MRLALILTLVLASAGRAADAPAPASPPATSPGRVLAGGAPSAAGSAAADAPPVEVVPDPSWKLCEIKASLLAMSPGKNVVADEKTVDVYLGEQLDLESDVTIPAGGGTALIHAKARLRAAAATDEGATFFISSDGVLKSTIGFQHPITGQDQFRNEMIQVGDQGTRLHEIFALPDLQLRVVMVLQVRPIAGREEKSAREMLQDPVAGDMRRFHVQAFLKDGDRYDPLEEATLTTMDGRQVGLSLTRFSTEGQGGTPKGMPGAPSVRMVTVPGVKESSAADMGAVRQLPADRRFQDKVDALQRSMHVEESVHLDAKLPGQKDIPATPRKISEKKRKKIQQVQKQQAVREWAIEQSKKLAPGADVPEGYQSEDLDLQLTPLRATQTSLQVEIALKGRLKLPKEDEFTAVDATTIEQLKFGEPLDVGIAELVRDGEPRYDYVLRITSEP